MDKLLFDLEAGPLDISSYYNLKLKMTCSNPNANVIHICCLQTYD